MPDPIRLAMLGTGDFALPTFLRLLETPHTVVALITQPDRPQGRKQITIPSRIKQAALDHGVRVEQPESINAPEGVALVQTLNVDLLVTAAYGQILSAEVLALPRFGGVNLHGSVLPSYRGAAPVARAIQHGDSETGVTVIQMTPRIDAGGMIAVARTPIHPDETAGELEARIAQLGAPLIAQAINDLIAGHATIIPQDKSLVSRAPKLRKEDGRIDWTRPALAIHNHVRAMQPWPIASTHWHRAAVDQPPTPLIIHKTTPAPGTGPPGQILEAAGDRLLIAAGSDALQILRLQLVGRKPLDAPDFLRGARIQPGDHLGDSPSTQPNQ